MVLIGDFQEAIKAVRFETNSDNPDLSDRIIKVQVEDGTSESNIALSTISVHSANDAPVITAGNDTGSVTEAGHTDNGTAVSGTPTVSNTLAATDPDIGDTQTWSIEGSSAGVYGSIVIDPITGEWTYALDNDLSTTQGLKEDDEKTETFTAKVTDGAGATDTKTITVTVNGTNDAPVITSDATAARGSVTEDATTNTATGTLTSSDVDVDTSANNNGATWSLDTTDGTYGSIAIDESTGEWTYTLDNANAQTQALKEGETKTETFTATITDDKGAKATQEITVTITGTNDDLVVVADTNSVTEDSADAEGHDDVNANTTIIAGNILTNDMDIDGDTLSVVGVAKGDTGSNLENANTIAQGVAGDYGTVTINEDGTYEYALDNTNATVQALGVEQILTETFTYTASSDGNGVLKHTTLSITINGSNDELVVVADTNSIAEDVTAPVTGDVLTNDTDVDGDTLNVVGVAKGNTGTNLENVATVGAGVDGDYGTVTIKNNGSYSYNLDSSNTTVQALGVGQTLTETFTYTASDGNGGLKNTTLTITINGANDTPQITLEDVGQSNADTDSATINETNTTLSAYGTLSLADVDTSDNVSMSVESVATTGTTYTGTLPSNDDLKGMFTITGGLDGTQSSDEHGVDWSFDSGSEYFNALASGETVKLTYTVKATDDNNATASHDVTITINGSNDAPEIQVLDGDATTGSLTETNGGLSVSNTLSLYDIDTSDTVSIAKVEGQTVTTGGTFAGTLPAGLDNDALLDMFSITGGEDSSSEQLAKNGATWTFDSGTEAFDFLPEGETLTLSYKVQATDSSGATNNSSGEETITITITGSNDAPVVQADTNSVTEDVVSTTVGGNVITGHDDGVQNNNMKDSDVDDGDTLTVTRIVTGTTAGEEDNIDANSTSTTNGTELTGDYGTLKIGADGSYSYNLDNESDAVQNLAKNHNPTDIFTYTVKDSQGNTQSTTLTITINGSNDAPVISMKTGDSNSAQHNETDNEISLNGTLSIADKDTLDTVNMSVESVSTNAEDILGKQYTNNKRPRY